MFAADEMRVDLIPTTDEIFVHVHYPNAPADGERMVVRTDRDWDADVEPVQVDRAAGRYEFRLQPDEPFCYFKPVLVQGDEERWACGPNRLATAGAPRIFDVFPCFTPAQAVVGELETLESEHGTWSYRAFLPPGYDENTLHRYPVLYMNDGHNLFFPREAAAGREWNVQETLRQLDDMTSIEQVIIIGVYSPNRMHDYAHSGGLDAYTRFLADSLVPHIDAKLRTLGGPANTGILGSSLGGAAAMSIAWSRSDRFGMVGCLSSTFGFDDDLKDRVLRDPRPDLRIYLDSGWPRDNFEVTRDMRARLVRAGFREGIDLLYFAFPGDRHDEDHWGDRSHVPFQFFFGHRPEGRSQAGRHAATA